MRIAIITTDYHPLRSSAAVQLRDLARELLTQGHQPVIIAPAEGSSRRWSVEVIDGVEVLRLAAPKMKSVGFVRRALAECWMPFAMLIGIARSPFRMNEWDAVVWYSPSIFFGPLVGALRNRSRCRSYLILRDIFPEWALDLGLLTAGPTYYFLRGVARYQYAVADTIGVQTESNLPYLQDWVRRTGRRLEVLHNWLAPALPAGSSIQIAQTPLAGRTIFVYIGNMGVAQSMDIMLDLAANLQRRTDIGFLFVGRGTEVPRLRRIAGERGLDNVVFNDEVDPREMPGLLAQCHVGLIALDPRHKSHNIPGKFLTYMQAGIPVLVRINPGTDLALLIEDERVGRAYVGDSVQELVDIAERLADDADERERMSVRGRALSNRMFSPTRAARQIVQALTSSNV